MALPVTPANGHHLTVDDVKKHAVTDMDTHFCPTRLISLENTLGGTILPLKVRIHPSSRLRFSKYFVSGLPAALAESIVLTLEKYNRIAKRYLNGRMRKSHLYICI